MQEETNLREGFTTGSCAAAAAKAAAMVLFKKQAVDSVSIHLPVGKMLTIPIAEVVLKGDHAYSRVIKDAGDDPDITHGVAVCAAVQKNQSRDIIIRGGRGVGIVTKPGLLVPPGQPAINPVPQQMICGAVREVIGSEQGVIITISVPEGERLANRTFNPKLGIVGGISILGTTGIVRPMSDKGLREALICSLDIAKARGWKTVILVPGNLGEQSVLTWFDYHADQIIQTSNFIGFMLQEAAKRGFRQIILAGHPGKLAKLVQGHFDTHSSKSSSAIQVIIKLLEEKGTSPEIINYCRHCSSVEAQIQYLRENNKSYIFNLLAQRIKATVQNYLNNRTITTEVALFSLKKELIGSTPNLLVQTQNLPA
jgi:cobalt-precorrin-5B (C1)-methyltransferase